MSVLFVISHPAHVHLFKNSIKNLIKNGKEVGVCCIDKEVTAKLLDSNNIPYSLIGSPRKGIFNKFLGLIKTEKEIYNLCKSENYQVIIGVATAAGSHVSRILDRKCIVLDDTDHSKYEIFLYRYFADKILTPNNFYQNLGKNHSRYNSYHEISYLSPEYFLPDKSVKQKIGLKDDEKYIVVRLVSYSASHDLASKGISDMALSKLIKLFSPKYKIIISSEREIDIKYKKYIYDINPNDFHSTLYFSNFCISDGSTTAVEASLLGVPTLHFEKYYDGEKFDLISNHLGYLKELDSEYGLFNTFNDEHMLIKEAINYSKSIEIKNSFKDKAEILFNSKEDLNQIIQMEINNLIK